MVTKKIKAIKLTIYFVKILLKLQKSIKKYNYKHHYNVAKGQWRKIENSQIKWNNGTQKKRDWKPHLTIASWYKAVFIKQPLMTSKQTNYCVLVKHNHCI